MQSIADALRHTYPVQIACLQKSILAYLATGFSVDRIALVDRLIGPSLLATSEAYIAVGHSYYPFTEELGTFAVDASPRLVRIQVGGFSSPHIRTMMDAASPITAVEAEGWLRAALGQRWADYAYQYGSAEDLDASAHRVRFAVVLDSRGDPLVVPDDFDWGKFDRGHPLWVRRLDPEI